MINIYFFRLKSRKTQIKNKINGLKSFISAYGYIIKRHYTHLEHDSMIVERLAGLLLPIVLPVATAVFHFLMLVAPQYFAPPIPVTTLACPLMLPIGNHKMP